MRLIRNFAYIALLAALTAIVAAACAPKSQREANAQASNPTLALVTTPIVWADSVEVGLNKAICRINVDFPISGTPLMVKQMHIWIARHMAQNDTLAMNAPQAYVERIGTSMLESAARDLQGCPMTDMTYEYLWDIHPAYKCDKFITYTCSAYSYLGGAHGSTTFYGATFGTREGTLFTYSMFIPTKIDEVRQMVAEAIRVQYFKASPEEFRQMLLIDDEEVPLPTSSPYYMADGVHFVYQQYEIAPYAAGLPECVIPYDQIKPYLIPRLRDIFND